MGPRFGYGVSKSEIFTGYEQIVGQKLTGIFAMVRLSKIVSISGQLNRYLNSSQGLNDLNICLWKNSPKTLKVLGCVPDVVVLRFCWRWR